MVPWLGADLPFPFPLSLCYSHCCVLGGGGSGPGGATDSEVTGRKARRISKKDTKRSTEKAGADEILQILGGLHCAVSIWFENASLNMK